MASSGTKIGTLPPARRQAGRHSSTKSHKLKSKQAHKHLQQAQHTTSADILLTKRSTEASATPAGNNNMVDDELEGGNPSPSPSASAPHGSDSCRNSKENSHGHDDTANVLLAQRSKQTPAAQADNNNMDELESSRLRPSASEPRDSDDDRNSKPNRRDDINRSSTQQNGTSEQFDSDVNASNDPSTNSSGKRNVLGLDDLSMNPSMIGPRGPSRFSAAVIGGLGGALLTL
eukprot:scaffold6476_cov116-Skeletonema_dohrnii-CCMP3373.AAC.1